MKILILGNYPPPFGGVPGHIRDFASHLASMGHDVRIISGGVGTINIVENNITVYKIDTKFKILLFLKYILKKNKIFKLREFWNLPKHYFRYSYLSEYLRIFPEITKDANVVLSYNLILFAPIGRIIANSLNIPHIISVFGELYNPLFSKASSIRFYRQTLDEADKIISCSRHCGSSIYNLSTNSFEAIQYGINTNTFVCLSDEVRSELRYSEGFHNECFIIGFIGRFSNELGFNDFINVATNLVSKYRNIKIIIAGNPEKNINKAIDLKNKFTDRVKIYANPQYTKLPEIINMLDLCLLPSRGARTCSSLAAMEAMSCGVRVIAYATGGIPEILDGIDGAYLVKEGDVNEMEKLATTLLIENKELNFQFRSEINALANRFDILKTNDKYFDVINSLVIKKL